MAVAGAQDSVTVTVGIMGYAVGSQDVGVRMTLVPGSVSAAAGNGDGSRVGGEAVAGRGGAAVGDGDVGTMVFVGVSRDLASGPRGYIDDAHQASATTSATPTRSPIRAGKRQQVRSGSNGNKSTVPPQSG